MTDIEFSINVEYNGWWLVVHPIVLQCFLYPRRCIDSSINSCAQFLGITCIITWIAVGCLRNQVYIFSAAISAVALASMS